MTQVVRAQWTILALIAVLTGVGLWWDTPWPVVLAVVAAVAAARTREPTRVFQPRTEPPTPVRVVVQDWQFDTELAVIRVGPDGNVVQASPRAVAVLGLSSAVAGVPLLQVGPPPELVAVVEAARGGDLRGRDAVGERLDVVLRPTLLPSGQVAVVVEDRTRVAEAERSRTDFVANVSHELRTPLSAILGFTETALLDRQRMDPALVEMLDAVYRNAERLRDLFSALLRLHRIEMRRRDLPLEVLPVGPLVLTAAGGGMDVARDKGVHFDVDLPAGVYAYVQTDALATAVSNLVANAVRYTPAGGRVRLTARRDGAEVWIEVADDGIGIEAAHQERIFERFYRVDDGRARVAGGTGLGLAIVKHLAIACGWRIVVDSVAGKGSTFRLILRAGERS